ncbi:DUF354 domain-containing protein [Candidatus Bathyarchaeota archaeon]|nr:DUF354 domain-containing protein [Candidatus Bathyarchaeota archaeon]
MRVWYDACTGKHVRYGAAIARRLRRAGHEVVFTTREHPDTLALAHALGENPIVVGKYDPSSLLTRLQESVNRMLQFLKLFRDDLPDAAISHQSVELCRVAFGLSIPIILTADTAHATAVNKLTIPLASTLLISEAIPKNLFKKFGAQKIIQFKGVDEVAWAKEISHPKTFRFKRPLIVVRQIETQAAYTHGKGDVTFEVAHRLSSLGTVVFLTRYTKTKDEKVVVMDEFVDSSSLAAQSDLVVSAGGTIAREAALQGIPSIALPEYGHIHVNDYLSKKGFPLFTVKPSKAVECATRYLGKKFDVRTKLADLEDPINYVEKILAGKQLESS